MASCREQPPVPIPPIFCVVVVTKILAPAELVATLVSFSPGVAKLASARKTAAEPRMKATKMRGLKMPDSESGVFFINFLAVHKCTVPNQARGYAENAESFTEDNKPNKDSVLPDLQKP